MVSGMIKSWEWTSNDVILHVLPLHHVHGIANVLLTPLACGAVCVMEPKFDAHRVCFLFGYVSVLEAQLAISPLFCIGNQLQRISNHFCHIQINFYFFISWCCSFPYCNVVFPIHICFTFSSTAFKKKINNMVSLYILNYLFFHEY